jgi:hypothetical protein
MFLRFIGPRCYSPESTGGTATPPPTGSDPGSSNAGGGDPGKVPASSSGDDSKTTDKTFTQADLDRIIKERLADSARRADQKAAADKRAAEEKALADNAEWKTLADQRGTELETTKAQAALAESYAKRLNALIDAEIAAWPDEVKSLDPGPKAVDSRLDWLEKSRALAKRLASLPKAPSTEAGAGSGTPPVTPAPGEGKAGEGGKGKTYRFTNPNDVSW